MSKAILTETRGLYTARHFCLAALVTAGYLLLSMVVIGFKMEQVYLALFFNTFYFVSRTTRKFITGFSVFIVFWIIFDYMKAFPNYRYNTVHIESLYHAEKTLFGINAQGTVLTPNEYWRANGNTFLDILSGIFYLCWVPVPLAFATYLFFKNREGFLQFSLSFLLVNLLGFIVYYIYPAAPPWYVQQQGFDFVAGTPGNSAGLAKFDLFFGAGIFESLYSKSSNVFAAMPSLHAAYPLVVLYYGIKYRLQWFNLVFVAIMFGIWFAAIYSSHHYILDVLAGMVCAVAGIALFQWLIRRNELVNKAMDRFANSIR